MSNFLITDFFKIKFNKKTNIIFKDEYLQNLYSEDLLKKYKYCYVENLDQVFNKDKKVTFIKKKTKKYLKDIRISLNKIHDLNLNDKDWGILLEYYILISVIALKRRFDFIKKVEKKKFKIISLQADFTFEDTEEYKKELLSNKNLNLYLNFLISKELNLDFLLMGKRKNIKCFKVIKISLFNKIIYYIKTLFIKIFKPCLIVDGYFGFHNSIKIFLKSKLKILFTNLNFFRKKPIIKVKSFKIRDDLNISINDQFDKIFKIYVKNTLPIFFLENFKKNLNQNQYLFKYLEKLGTALHLASSDEFKLLAMMLKRKKKRVFNIQHGGQLGERKFSPEDYINNKYANFNFYWNDKSTGVGPTYFENMKISKEIKDKSILFFPTNYFFKEEIENLKLSNHIFLNQYIPLIKNLDKVKYRKLFVKFFRNNALPKKIWKKKFGNRVTFLKKSYKGSIFKNYDIVIIDNFSTAFYELLYYKKPFFIICSSNLEEFKTRFSRLILNLKKINILFDDELELAKYLNDNHNLLMSNWLKAVKSKEYKAMRDYIFPKREFNHTKFIKLINRI